MDVKLRKLISRLSLKEKDKTSVGQESKAVAVAEPNSHKIVSKKKNKLKNIVEVEEDLGLSSVGGDNCCSSSVVVGENTRKTVETKEDYDYDGKVIVVTEKSLANIDNNSSGLFVTNYNCKETIKTRTEDSKEEIEAEEEDITVRKPIIMLSIDTNNHHYEHVTNNNLNENNNNNGINSKPLLIYSTSRSSTPPLILTSPSSSSSCSAGSYSLLSTSPTDDDYADDDGNGMELLKDLHFSAPTLVRKKKKHQSQQSDVQIIYEELKPGKPRLYLKKGEQAINNNNAAADLLLCNEIIGPETTEEEAATTAMVSGILDLDNDSNDSNGNFKDLIKVIEINNNNKVYDKNDIINTTEKLHEETEVISTTAIIIEDDDEEDTKSESSTTSSSLSRSTESSCPNSVSTNSSNGDGDISESSSSLDENNNNNNGPNLVKKHHQQKNVDKVYDKVGNEKEAAEKADDESIYVNLQELELARRKLIAAQVVKAKYAENWIDDQVINDSIISNKERTKQYWEIRLRRDQEEQTKANRKVLNNTSSAVIQKMNAEIEELHRRERELKKMNHLKTSDDDEDEDAFSSNGSSSVDEFEHSESPRLESGFYSNIGEEDLISTTISSPELAKTNEIKKDVKVELLVDLSNNSNDDNSSSEAKEENGNLKNKDDSNEEVTYSYHIANYRKETPIEREIRLAHEREQEYKRRLSTASVDSQPQLLLNQDPPEEIVEPPPKPVSVVSTRDVFESRSSWLKNKNQAGKDIQYILATDRLKREIQEARQREEELKARTNNVNGNLSVDTNLEEKLSRSSSISEETEEELKADVVVEKVQPPLRKPVVIKRKVVETEQKPTVITPVQEKVTKVHTVAVNLTPTVPEKAVKVQTGVVEMNSAPEEPPAKPNPTPITTNYNSFLARPKFNSIERYLLKSSAQFRIGTNFQIPKPEPEPPAAQEQKEKVKEEKGEEDNSDDEPKMPRRRLVSTQYRIAEELKEMREREKELAQIRKYKSTSDLTYPSSPMMLSPSISNFNQNENDEEDVFIVVENGFGGNTNNTEDNNNANNIIKGQSPPLIMTTKKSLGRDIFADEHNNTNSVLLTNGFGKGRKKSALVSQWEEKIHGNNLANESKA